MVWRATDPQGNEAGKIKYEIVKYTRGVVLDLGCGPSKAFPQFVGVDSGKDTELFGVQMRPDVTIPDCAVLSEHFIAESCDALFSSHLLEHMEDTVATLRQWWAVIKPGGYLVLYLPHKDYYPRIGQPGANPDHKHDFDNTDIWKAMRQAVDSFDLVVDEVRADGFEYSFLQVYQKTAMGYSMSHAQPKPEKTACVVRYGGFGDMLQTANILPELKRQGYHVTVMTTPKGQDVLKHDPHIDDWYIEDQDQVPNSELTLFWQAQAKHFDKFINLSESVEGTLLALPGRTNHAWPDAVRSRHLGRNYLEWTSELAELPYASEARFYPNFDESIEVQRYLHTVAHSLAIIPQPTVAAQIMGAGKVKARERIAGPMFAILWVLAGSSIHKFYPWQDQVIARVLLDMPEAVVIFSGDHACTLLEAGWENEPRVRCESGKLSIRQSLTLAQNVQCVVGPETGVLNAVAFEQVPKVVLLSHSSPENLTKHWVNAQALEPSVPCYPCHRLHYGREFCFEHADTGAAMCQVSITPDRVYDGIKRAYDQWKDPR